MLLKSEGVLTIFTSMRDVAKDIKHSFEPREEPAVNFLICGTQKGGTSALDAYLREHPAICMAYTKEVHYFDNEKIFHRNKPDYSWYHSFFSPQPSHQFLGESTPAYMYWYDSPKRIWQYNPKMKLIVILRNPIQRAYSHWNMERSLETEQLSFWDALQCERERSREGLPHQHRVYSYIDRGFYTEQLRRLWAYFPQEQTLLLRTEELKAHPWEVLGRVHNFLEVDALPNINTPKDVNSRPYLAPMGSREKKYLQSVFEYEIRSLERLLNWDCSQWLTD
jgi:hypothetical protein